MNLLVERVEVWAASIEDKPGSLANILSVLREAGADLNFILARRTLEAPDRSEVFVTHLRGDAELEAAATLGFNLTGSVRWIRVEGENRLGVAVGLPEPHRDGGMAGGIGPFIPYR